MRSRSIELSNNMKNACFSGFNRKNVFLWEVYRFPVFNIIDCVWYVYSVKAERILCLKVFDWRETHGNEYR